MNYFKAWQQAHLKEKVFSESESLPSLSSKARRCGVPLTTSLFSLTFHQLLAFYNRLYRCTTTNFTALEIAKLLLTAIILQKELHGVTNNHISAAYLFLNASKTSVMSAEPLCSFAGQVKMGIYLDWLLSHRSFTTWVICDDDATDYKTMSARWVVPMIPDQK